MSNNIKKTYSSEGLCIIHILGLTKNSLCDLDFTHIEQCDFHVTRMILTKTYPRAHFNMHHNVKQDDIEYN